MNTFAERVREERKRAGLNQGQLAELAGLSQSTISDIERGRNEGSRDLVALAKALKVNAEWLVTGLSEKQIGSETILPHVAVTEIRRSRLRRWFATQTLPEKEKSYLSQLIGGKASFGEKAARRLEGDYGMPDGYLDKPLDQQAVEYELVEASGSSTELVGRIQERLDSLRWNWSDLALALGMSEQRLTNWKKRGVPASQTRSVEIALKLPRFALDVADLRHLGAHAVEQAELLEVWGYLLPAEKQAIMDQIRPMAAHNKAVLEQLQKPQKGFAP